MMERKVKKKKKNPVWMSDLDRVAFLLLLFTSGRHFSSLSNGKKKERGVQWPMQINISLHFPPLLLPFSVLLCSLSWSSVCSIANIALSLSFFLLQRGTSWLFHFSSTLLLLTLPINCKSITFFHWVGLNTTLAWVEAIPSFTVEPESWKALKKRKGEEKQNIDNLEV